MEVANSGPSLANGQTVWLAFATANGTNGKPCAWVNEAVVLDCDNMVVRRVEGGHVSVLSKWSVETAHATESDAWQWCSDQMLEFSKSAFHMAMECLVKPVHKQSVCTGGDET